MFTVKYTNSDAFKYIDYQNRLMRDFGGISKVS